jgi:hypothetical protein
MRKIMVILAVLASGILFCIEASSETFSGASVRVSQDEKFMFVDITNIGKSAFKVNKKMTSEIGGYKIVFIKDKKTYPLSVLPHYYHEEADDVELGPMMGVGVARDKSLLMSWYHLKPGCYDMELEFTIAHSKSKRNITINKYYKNICFSANFNAKS